MRLLFALAAFIAIPAMAQVEIDQKAGFNHLEPNWQQLNDGSQLAIMVATDLNGTLLIRCWEHENGAICIRLREIWITGYLFTSIDWEELENVPQMTLPIIEDPPCTQILGQIEDDGSLTNCSRLLELVNNGGPLAIARARIDQLAPLPENLPSSLLRSGQ